MKYLHPTLLALSLTLAGCSASQVSRVPGIENSSQIVKLDYVPPVKDVLTALKDSMGQVFEDLDLKIETGSGTFQGTTQLVDTDRGSVLAVFPFTGYAGSTLTPNVGLSSRATGTQSSTLVFSFKQTTGAGPAVGQRIDDSDPFCRYLRSVIASVQQAAPTAGQPQPQLAFTNRELRLSVSFSVRMTGEAGLGVVLIPSGPDVDSVAGGPLFGSSTERLGTYTVDLTIPLLAAQPNDPRRIVSGRFNATTGEVYLIDRPFTIDFHKANHLDSAGNKTLSTDFTLGRDLYGVKDEPVY